MANTTRAVGVGSVSVSGLVPLKSQVASIAGVIPDITLTMTAKEDGTAQIAGIVPRVTAAIACGAIIEGAAPLVSSIIDVDSPNLMRLNGVIPEVTASGWIATGTVARIAGNVPLVSSKIFTGGNILGVVPTPTGLLAATREEIATIEGTVPEITSSINVLSEGAVARIFGLVPPVYPGSFARLDGVVPLVTAAISVSPLGVVEGWALNVRNGAVSRLQGYPFKQFAKVGARTYAVGPGGLYEITGKTFAGQPVAWEMQTGLSDFGNPAIKHLPYVYLDGIVDGEIEITFINDRGNEYRYLYTGEHGNQHLTHRRKLGNAIRTRNGAFRIGSPKGAYFEMDSLEPEVNLTKRSIG